MSEAGKDDVVLVPPSSGAGVHYVTGSSSLTETVYEQETRLKLKKDEAEFDLWMKKAVVCGYGGLVVVFLILVVCGPDVATKELARQILPPLVTGGLGYFLGGYKSDKHK